MAGALHPADGRLLDAVRRLRWPARRLVAGGITGAHLARPLGHSQEFTDYRTYRPGDELNRIDWKLLARTDRPYIRLAKDQNRLATLVLVDASASLAWPEPDHAKWEQVRRIALALTAAAYQGGDPVGIAIGAAAGIRQLPIRNRRGVVQETAMLLRGIAPGGATELTPALRASRRARRVAIVSDFLGDAEALLASAGALVAQGREVYAIHVVHPGELDPAAAEALMRDPEQPELRRSMSAAIRGAYLDRFGRWMNDLAREWRLRGARFERVICGEEISRVIRRVVASEGRR